ncbi:ornithine cyclodeaminase family protein [Piscinibacter koreensis]|uniref:Ornithine cyclodeaminase family protein n=1 Tax=Piscinibacter koreensis TaxID=2742824 RepID=A0A7Y6NMC9_9BURK|nr:ornithine cyclodeaminase family protein [Schlegelella koreensis]NUZ05851.1 ornithine cyclodeaminase family protein [Schlegelella koreensis]
MRVHDAAAVRAALPFNRLIDALRAAFADDAAVPTRHVHAVGGGAVTSLLMPAWQDGRYYAVKVVNIAPGNAARGLAGVHATVLLHDATTGVPLACIDGSELTARRTAAASALAASYLARPDARRLLVVGAGRVAALLPEAYRAVRPIERVDVWARRPGAAEALAAQWRQQGVDARAVTSLERAVVEADVVSCATLATAPLIAGAWLGAGSHLDLIGSFTPAMREADDACFAGARVWIDTEEALAKSGDLLDPLARGVLAPGDVVGTLAGLCRGAADTRASAGERTVFKSVGSALEDLAAAVLVAESSATGTA